MGGIQVLPQHKKLRMIPHNALIILRYQAWGQKTVSKFFRWALAAEFVNHYWSLDSFLQRLCYGNSFPEHPPSPPPGW